jgi:hypothetical protein
MGFSGHPFLFLMTTIWVSRTWWVSQFAVGGSKEAWDGKQQLCLSGGYHGVGSTGVAWSWIAQLLW